MKKVTTAIFILLLISFSAYLIIRKESVVISEVDFYNYRKPVCKNGQLEFDFPDNQKSSYQHHYAFLKYGKGEKVIPLTLIHDKSGKFFRPRDAELGCLEDIIYSQILSFKNKVSINDLRVLDSKISDMKLNRDEFKCVDDKIVLTTEKLTSKIIDLGGVEMSLFTEKDGKIDILINKELTVSLNDSSYLFISLNRMRCESKHNWYYLDRAISIINLENSNLLGTKKVLRLHSSILPSSIDSK